jgi:hypothetical protein
MPLTVAQKKVVQSTTTNADTASADGTEGLLNRQQLNIAISIQSAYLIGTALLRNLPNTTSMTKPISP